jgi:hypothetical protein
MLAVMGTTTTRQAEREARRVIRACDDDPDRLRAVTDLLDRHVRRSPLERLVRLWDLSNAEAGRFFGVSRQAFAQWLAGDPPASRATAIADLAAATDGLDRHVKRERIPAVVRRKAQALGGRSLLDLARAGLHRELREAIEAMFDLRRVQP